MLWYSRLPAGQNSPLVTVSNVQDWCKGGGCRLTEHFQNAHVESDLLPLEGELGLFEDVAACGEVRDGHHGDHADDEGRVFAEAGREGQEVVELFN